MAEPEKRNDKEERILQAAVHVFAENGYHGSKMAQVADAAGVATGTIYLYFRRKQDLLISLFQRHLGGYIERCKPELLAEPVGVARLRRMVAMHLEFYAEDRALASVFQIHAREPDPALREGIQPAVAEYFELITAVVQDGVDAGEFAADVDVRLARDLFFGALDQVVTRWLHAKHAFSLMSVHEPLAAMLARGLGARGAT
jgi:TetR/AcrR family fatty acid metabolism transcriptional regulator